MFDVGPGISAIHVGAGVMPGIGDAIFETDDDKPGICVNIKFGGTLAVKFEGTGANMFGGIAMLGAVAETVGTGNGTFDIAPAVAIGIGYI